MSPKTQYPMIAILLTLGGAVFGVLGALHAIYTMLDLRNPRRLAPVDPSVARAMANSAVIISGGGTDMWRAWIGFNFSHSLGLLLFAALSIWAGFRVKALPVGVMPLLTLVGCIYLFSPCSTGFAFLPSALPLVPAVSPPHGSFRCADWLCVG
jgi:hypothetical protein